MRMRHSLVLLCIAMALAFIAGAARGADGDFVWADGMGGTGDDVGADIVVDSAGNVYTTGSFQLTSDFDPGLGTYNLTSAGGSDIFVAKFDSAGNLLWARQIGGESDDEGAGIALDAENNVLCTGYFSATADFDPGAGSHPLVATGGMDSFVLKLDGAGNFTWARRLGGFADGQAWGIAVDNAGAVFTAGTFAGTADFDPGASECLLDSAGGFDVYVSKLDLNGQFVWAKRMGGSGNDTCYDLALDASGNVHTTGQFAGVADFDPSTANFSLNSAGDSDIFVSKLDNTGNLVWAKALGGTGGDCGLGIAVGPSGSVHVTGYFFGTADFDPDAGSFPLTSTGGQDVFIAKLDSSGSFQWAKSLGGASYDFGLGITVDAAGSVLTTGCFGGTVDFDPNTGVFTVVTVGAYDVFLSKLDSAGNFVWAKTFGWTSNDFGRKVALDSAGAPHTTGKFQNSPDFDPGSGLFYIPAAGGTDIFVSKLAPPPDTTPPTGNIVINNNKLATKSVNVALSLSWADGVGGSGVSRMRFSDDGATWTPWESLVYTRAYALPAGDGYKTVRVQYLDRANNKSAVYNDYIRLDTVPPTGSILINGGATTTTSLNVSLNLSWADVGGGVTRMRFSDNGSTWTAWEGLKYTKAHTLPAGLGYHTVRVQYTDIAENYSAIYNDYIKVVAP